MEGVVFVDGGCLRHTATSVHIYARYCNGIRLECCPVLFDARRGGIDEPAVLIPAILDGNILYVLPRPYHAVQAYLIGCGLYGGSMGILVE